MLCPLCRSVMECSAPPPSLAATDQPPPQASNCHCSYCGHTFEATNSEAAEAQPEICPMCHRVADKPMFEADEGILVYDCGDHVFFARKATGRAPQ
jgi:hypothetical protein